MGVTLRRNEVMSISWLVGAEDMMLPDAGIGGGESLQTARRSELWLGPSMLAVVASCRRPERRSRVLRGRRIVKVIRVEGAHAG